MCTGSGDRRRWWSGHRYGRGGHGSARAVPAARPRAGATGAGAAAVAVAEGVDPRLVRKWAESQGRVISERGRLSSGLIKDYRRAREPAGE
ncbi:Lsr2 family DNA-binding protein [Kitasatospora cineracea]|uniref:Lsr2 family DNA-binding protein n=1 Tax=Kitasatospora cineracea TaxID=88074 RepID=UPI000F4FD988